MSYSRMENVQGGQQQQPPQQSALSQLLNCLCCVGLITLVVIGSLCIEAIDNSPYNNGTSVLCGPAGRSGGVAMVAVGATFLGLQLFIVFCTLCIAGGAIGIIAATSAFRNTNTDTTTTTNPL